MTSKFTSVWFKQELIVFSIYVLKFLINLYSITTMVYSFKIVSYNDVLPIPKTPLINNGLSNVFFQF